MNENQKPRRDFLKLGGAVAVAIPLLASSRWAEAAKNDALRTAFKYQDKPDADKMCSNCLHFEPGKTPTAMGGCKIMAGDTEIAPNGYCAVWLKKT